MDQEANTMNAEALAADPRMGQEGAIHAQAVRHVYGGKTVALDGVDLDIGTGFFGLLGPNGAGKSTFMRILCTLLVPTEGGVTVGGHDVVRERRAVRSRIGYLPQEFSAWRLHRVEEVLETLAILSGVSDKQSRKGRIAKVLEQVGLTDVADRKVKKLSGGMVRRLGVAQALVHDPKVLIVDEPTVGLDPRERIRFRNLLSRLAEGRVVLFSTHVVEDVAVACERVLVFARGRLVFDESPANLAEQAEGRVWELWLPEGDAEARLPQGALIVDQVPGASGEVRSRVLSDEAPHPDARSVEPTAEDGYLWLVGAGTAA